MNKPMTAKELRAWAARNGMVVGSGDHFYDTHCIALYQQGKKNTLGVLRTLCRGQGATRGAAMRALCRKVNRIRSATT